MNAHRKKNTVKFESKEDRRRRSSEYIAISPDKFTTIRRRTSVGDPKSRLGPIEY